MAISRKPNRPLTRGALPLVHIDIETLSRTAPNAAVIQIGAVYNADPEYGGGTFNVVVDFDDAMKHGDVETDTLRWHLRDAERAKLLGLVGSDHHNPDFRTALLQFVAWYNALKAKVPDIRPCTRDLDFDIAILTHHLKAMDIPVPWRYYEPIGHRSSEGLLRQIIMNLTGVEVPRYIDFNDVKHDAHDDALQQKSYLDILFFITCHKHPGAGTVALESLMTIQDYPPEDRPRYIASLVASLDWQEPK